METYSPRRRQERLIGAGRVVLAVSSLLAVWLDPSEPVKHAEIAYGLLGAYVVYAVAIALVAGRFAGVRHATFAGFTHAFDLLFFSLFIYFTAGPASPFIAYFVFSLVCATLRWGWRGTLWTAAAALAAFLGAGIYFGEILNDPAFELWEFIIRGVYLAVVAVLLGHLGVAEQRTRAEIGALAALPHGAAGGGSAGLAAVLESAATALRAPRVLLAWTVGDEPWLELALWAGGSMERRREPPERREPLVPKALAACSFLSEDAGADRPSVVVAGADGATRRWSGRPLDRRLAERYRVERVLSVPVAGDTLDGRLFVLDRAGATADDLLLAGLVGQRIASFLDLEYLHRRLRDAAATEERIRLARDLHDGVLQSLTAIALRVAAARRLAAGDPAAASEQLEEALRQVVREQRDLRFFIQELKPPLPDGVEEGAGLERRLAKLAERIEREWGLRVALATGALETPVSGEVAHEIYQLVREAMVNAVRHGEASEVRVEISVGDRSVAIVVADNGRGFPFQGRFHDEALRRLGLGPKSLRERVSALAGSLALDSSADGARLEIELPRA